MGKRLEVKTGERYGCLTVITEIQTKGAKRRFLCKCDCGNEAEVALGNLRNGNTKSCGCFQKDNASKAHKTHGLTGTRIYGIWGKMIGRCHNKRDHRYKHYGGRGISVCEEWRSFENFYEWAVNSKYEENLTLERIDVNAGYSPTNCKWATWKQQQNNRTNNRLINFEGKTMTLQEWSELIGIEASTLRYRLVNDWSIDDAINTPVGSPK